MLRYIVAIIITFHALIHLMGFYKSRGSDAFKITGKVSGFTGWLWLLCALLLIATAIGLFLNTQWWMIPGSAAVLLSQSLIFLIWRDARYGSIINLLIIVCLVIGYKTWRFEEDYKQLVTEFKSKTTAPSDILQERDLTPLPEAVKRYIRYCGFVGKPKINHFTVTFTGHIRKNNESEWMPFTSEQHNFINPSVRLFFMKASMKHLPVNGLHAYKTGKAFMDIRLLSLFKVQYQQGREMDTAETVTFFNDMCCMAPGSLIDERITWQKTNSDTVNAHFTANGIGIDATLIFNKKGQLADFISGNRYAAQEDGSMKKLPWRTPLKNYKLINGYTLAGYAETIYDYPVGPLCYGNFRLTGIKYN